MDSLLSVMYGLASGKQFSDNEALLEMNVDRQLLLTVFNRLRQHDENCPEVLTHKRSSKTIETRDDKELDEILKPNDLVNIQSLMKSVNQTLYGKFFLCRVLEKPIVGTQKVLFVVEDKFGKHAVTVHFSFDPFPLIPSFNPGTYLAILEPLFKSDGNGTIWVCCLDPKEVIVLTRDQIRRRLPDLKWHDEHNDDEKSVMKIRTKGNKLFVDGKYEEALKTYSDGLNLEPSNVELLSNRSLCFLKLVKFEKALDDALKCLELNPVHVKAIYRASQAYFGLGQYEIARDLLSAKMEVLKPPSKVIKDLLAKAKERISQRNHGVYNMAELYKNRMEPVIHDVAEYYGPVKIDDVGEKGGGLFVTKDVEAGTLLFCCKVFASYTAPQTAISLQSLELETFIDLVADKIKKNPEVGKDLYQLFAGKEMGSLDPSKDNCTMVYKERIRRIVKYNSFKEKLIDSSRYDLFILPSYINNNCIDVNCLLTFYGDLCQARSTKPLKKGQEVLISYNCSSCRSLIAEKNFDCECAICKYERQEPSEIRFARTTLQDSFMRSLSSKPKDFEEKLKRMRELSVGSPFAAHYLCPLLYKLGKFYYDRKQYKKAMRAYKELLEDWRKRSQDYVQEYLIASLNLFHIYLVLNDITNMKKIKEEALELTKINFGCMDLSALEVVHPGATNMLGLLDL